VMNLPTDHCVDANQRTASGHLKTIAHHPSCTGLGVPIYFKWLSHDDAPPPVQNIALSRVRQACDMTAHASMPLRTLLVGDLFESADRELYLEVPQSTPQQANKFQRPVPSKSSVTLHISVSF
jgi:hypothetical protein